MKFATLVLLSLFSFNTWACTLYWDHADTGWLEGFKIYQGGVETGTVTGSLRSSACADVGLVPGPGPITMTAYRGADESSHSAPAVFELSAPGVRITIEVQ